MIVWILNELEISRQGFDTWSKTTVKKKKEWMLILRDKILEKEEILRKSISMRWENHMVLRRRYRVNH